MSRRLRERPSPRRSSGRSSRRRLRPPAKHGGGAGDFLHHRLGGGLREPYVTETLAHGGVVLWVLLGHEDEPEVAHLLRKAGGRELRLEHVPSAAEIEAAGA